MADGVTQPSHTPLEEPSFKPAQKHPIPVMGWRSGGSSDIPTGGGGYVAGKDLIDNSVDGTSTTLTGFKDGQVYELTLMDNGTAASIVPDNVHIRIGSDAVAAATTGDYPWMASLIPVIQIHFKAGQTGLSIIRAAGGTKTMSLYARRLI